MKKLQVGKVNYTSMYVNLSLEYIIILWIV